MTIADSGCLMNNGASCLPLPPEEENRIIADMMKESELNLKEGNIYYVISNRWFSVWQRYAGFRAGMFVAEDQPSTSQVANGVRLEPADRPGPIDNSNIISDSNSCAENSPDISRTLVEGMDYVLVPQKVWEKLFEWYKGGPALPRKLISQGAEHKQYNVEVYPLCLKVTDARDNSISIVKISKKATTRELYETVCKLRLVEPQKAHIWDYFNKEKSSLLNVSDQTLEDANLLMDHDILLEVPLDKDQSSHPGLDSVGNGLALVPLEPSRSSVSIAGGPTLTNGHSIGSSNYLSPGTSLNSTPMDIDHKHDAYRGERNGLAGLQNLGNTCFMNSALQCLVHTPPLAKYFLQDDYNGEINVDNPLGMRGELALAFGDLLRKLWSSGKTAVAPRVFKGKLGRFAPQFSGYNQHDSQELLAFLLDGLHEDLNRVKQKPYIEMKDADGRPDEEVAYECWKNHIARNDSLIVDVCQGQYKSTLVCPVCGKISITFDPFMYLSLPLPSTVTRTMTLTVLNGDGSSLPMPFTVTVLKHGCCKDLCHALGIACCLESDEMLLLAEVYEHKIYRYLENPLENLTSIKDEDHIVAYRLKKGSQKTKLEIIHRYVDRLDNNKGGERKLFGTPLVTYLEEETLYGANIETYVDRMLSPLRRTAYSSGKSCNEKENGVLAVGGDQSNGSNNVCVPSNQTIDGQKQQGCSNGEMSFQLVLSSDRPLSCTRIEKDSPIKPGPVIRVFLDWTDRDNELYDASFLGDLPEVHKTGFTVKKTRQEAISLFSCLEAFLTEEPLGPDDMWYCPRCKEHRQATKKLDLWNLPDILVFHLKRFSYSRYLKNKLDTCVNFPIHNLNLTKFVKSNDGQPYVYNLYAISNHYGGLGGGHYTAYAKLIDENRWYHFDDSHVSPVAESDIQSPAAYVLFYQRVTPSKGEASQGHTSS